MTVQELIDKLRTSNITRDVKIVVYTDFYAKYEISDIYDNPDTNELQIECNSK